MNAHGARALACRGREGGAGRAASTRLACARRDTPLSKIWTLDRAPGSRMAALATIVVLAWSLHDKRSDRRCTVSLLSLAPSLRP